LIDNKNAIGGKEQAFVAHLQEMFPVVSANMQRKAQQMIMKKKLESFMQQPMQPGQGGQPQGGQGVPSSMPNSQAMGQMSAPAQQQ
jgi:hypothetical protein